MSKLKAFALACGAAALPGCSILSPTPVIELAKAGGAAIASAISTGPSSAKNTVYHEHNVPEAVCVEYNPQTPDPDIAPALQAELKNHEIESRIYEAGSTPTRAISASRTRPTSSGARRRSPPATSPTSATRR